MRWLGVAQRVSGENVVERIFKDARGFRIYDGPNEVHRMSLARKILARKTEELKR
jgi:alkylation response protein AidB-like acyl-CoA dehydrogenase